MDGHPDLSSLCVECYAKRQKRQDRKKVAQELGNWKSGKVCYNTCEGLLQHKPRSVTTRAKVWRDDVLLQQYIEVRSS